MISTSDNSSTNVYKSRNPRIGPRHFYKNTGYLIVNTCQNHSKPTVSWWDFPSDMSAPGGRACTGRSHHTFHRQLLPTRPGDFTNDFWRFLKGPGARWKCVEFLGFWLDRHVQVTTFHELQGIKNIFWCWKNVSYMSRWYEPSPCELRSGYGARAGYNEQMEIGTWQISTVALADADTHHWGSLSGWRFQNSNVFIFTNTHI